MWVKGQWCNPPPYSYNSRLLIYSGTSDKGHSKKEDKPLYKGQCKYTVVHTLCTEQPLKEDNLSTMDKNNGWSQTCYLEAPL